MARYNGYQGTGNRQPRYVQRHQGNNYDFHHSNQGMSYSERKRAKLDYRRAYFAHNPGLFGVIWKCAYCQRPIFGKSHVEVDHIIPLNNPLGQNARYNLVAACRKCNRAKSDTADGRIVVGYVSKIVDTIVMSIQKLFLIGVGAVWTGVWVATTFLFTLLVKPLKSRSLIVRVIAIAVYAICIWYIITML